MRRALVIGIAGLLVGACGLPFGLGRPSTSQLINGAGDSLAKATGFEVAGTFKSTDTYKIDLQYTAPSTLHMSVTQNTTQFELLQIGGKVYYRGKAFVASVAGTDTAGQALARAVGDRWFTSKDATPLDMTSITDANKVKANFLTTASVNRKDDVSVGGTMTAELSYANAIVNITESSPYQLVRLRTQPGKTVDQVTDEDLAFGNYGKDFGIAQPTNVFQMDDQSTWPPLYNVVSVENSRCNDPCVLSAVLQNTGGTTGASAPSTVTFTLTSDADNSTLGTCKVAISPDVPNGQKVTESCSISSAAWTNFSGHYHYAANPDNPAYD